MTRSSKSLIGASRFQLMLRSGLQSFQRRSPVANLAKVERGES